MIRDGKEQKPRITLYCRDERQKEYIQNGLRNIGESIESGMTLPNILEYMIYQELKRLKRYMKNGNQNQT